MPYKDIERRRARAREQAERKKRGRAPRNQPKIYFRAPPVTDYSVVTVTTDESRAMAVGRKAQGRFILIQRMRGKFRYLVCDPA
jgi:hypothetical protein